MPVSLAARGRWSLMPTARGSRCFRFLYCSTVALLCVVNNKNPYRRYCAKTFSILQRLIKCHMCADCTHIHVWLVLRDVSSTTLMFIWWSKMQTQTEDPHKQIDCVQDLLSALQSSFHAFQDLFQVFKLSDCPTELHGGQKDPNITMHTSYRKNGSFIMKDLLLLAPFPAFLTGTGSHILVLLTYPN